MKDTKRVRCKYCNSTFVYYKVKEDTWQCRSCGKIFKVKKVEEKDGSSK